MKRNPGRFKYKITLLKPSANTRDELGGIATTTFTEQLTCFAMCEQRNQTHQQVIGDYVTADTRYFVVRDIRSKCEGMNTQWRLKHNGIVYLINDITLDDEDRPPMVQITATAINAGGGIV